MSGAVGDAPALGLAPAFSVSAHMEDPRSLALPETEQAPAPSQRMGGLLMGHFAAQCIHAVAVLGIADLLLDGDDTIEGLASATRCHGRSLQRVLRILVRLGVFTETAAGRFGVTAVGATLRGNTSDSLRDAAIFVMSPPLWASCGSLLDTLRNGEPAFVKLHNATLYDYLSAHPAESAEFNRFMTNQSHLHNAAIVEAYDFSGIRTLIDVGGGHGATLTAVLRRYPAMNGILFDLPEVAENARLEMSDVAGRCEVVGGDMLRGVPGGGDAYIIKRVMMDQSDGDAKAILGNCLTAMNAGGKVLVVDPMLPDSNEPHPNWLTDMISLTICGGQCRTEAEFGDLFNEVGLTLARVITTRSPNFILEAARATA